MVCNVVVIFTTAIVDCLSLRRKKHENNRSFSINYDYENKKLFMLQICYILFIAAYNQEEILKLCLFIFVIF